MIANMCLTLALATANGIDCQQPVRPLIYDMPLLATVYDTALCEPSVACLQGNGDGLFASMIPVSNEWYGVMAACPPELFGQWLSISGLGDVYCGDSFGSINGVPVETIVQLDNSEWVMRIDVFYDTSQGYPEWNYYLFYDWALK